MSDARTGQLLAAILEHKHGIEREAHSDEVLVSEHDRKLWAVLDAEKPEPGYHDLIVEGLALLREIRNAVRPPQGPPG